MSVLVATTGTADQREVTTRAVSDVLDFAAPPPGLRDLRQFELAALDDAGYLFALRSVQDPQVRLFVVPPEPYFPGYAPQIDAATRAVLGLGLDEGEALLLVVVHPGQDDAPPTANLLAPMAVNPSTGSAVQVVLDDDQWSLRAPLTAAGSAA